MVEFILPSPWIHLTVPVEKSADASIRSWDVKMLTPSSTVTLMNVATVLGYTWLPSVNPGLVRVLNRMRVPISSMYSKLCHVMESDPLVTQVMVMGCPGHATSPSNVLAIEISCERTDSNKAKRCRCNT